MKSVELKVVFSKISDDAVGSQIVNEVQEMLSKEYAEARVDVSLVQQIATGQIELPFKLETPKTQG